MNLLALGQYCSFLLCVYQFILYINGFDYIIQELQLEIFRKKSMLQSKPTSILKPFDENLKTASTHDQEAKWINKNDINKMRVQFKSIQVKLLNMFTLAKSQLSSIYQKIVSKIKRIEKCLQGENGKINPTFWNVIEEIENQVEIKINAMGQNIEKTVTSTLLFDHLLSLIPDYCTTEHDLSSQRKINNSNSTSLNNKLLLKNNQTIVDIDCIGVNQYKSAIRIRPNQKRIENLGCLSGKWDLLETINLQNRQISRMIPFVTVMADVLQQINLSFNEITSLSFLKDAEYPMLRLLNLKKNSISSIDGIQNTKFPNLKILNLSQNKIKRIECLKQCAFPELIQLNLSTNKIQKPDILTDCDFSKLQILNLDNNGISNLDFVASCSFYRLKILSFCYNQIKRKFQKLQALLAYNNKIQSIECLQRCDFPILKQIILNNNLIQDISVVEKLKFKNLTEFDLENNNIQPKQVFCFVTKNDQCKKAKKRYPFIQL